MGIFYSKTANKGLVWLFVSGLIGFLGIFVGMIGIGIEDVDLNLSNHNWLLFIMWAAYGLALLLAFIGLSICAYGVLIKQDYDDA